MENINNEVDTTKNNNKVVNETKYSGRYDTEEKRRAKIHMNSLFMFAISTLLVWYSFKTSHKIEGFVLTLIPIISLLVAYKTREIKK